MYIYHCYAGDRQFYVTVERDECIVAAMFKIKACVAEEADWMERNQLNLNKEKSVAIIFLTANKPVELSAEISLTIVGHRDIPKSSERNLGALFDSGLTMETQVVQMTRSSYCQKRNIG